MQHQSVGAGRPFQQLQKAGMRTAKLDQIVRQRDPFLKSEVEMLAMAKLCPPLNRSKVAAKYIKSPIRRKESLRLHETTWLTQKAP